MSMKTFADFWRGMFFLASTLIIGVLLYLLVVVWQPLWTGGFEDFEKISQAIEDLDTTAKPAVAAIPNMLKQMEQMNQNMEKMNHNMTQMNRNITRMDMNVAQMKDVMNQEMGMMNYQIDRLNDKLSPAGVMPFNW